MKKTNFFKLFLVGAIALTVGLSSCTGDVSKKDFEKACEKIAALENDVASIKDKLNNLGVVQDIKSKAGDPYTLVVTYTNGKSAEIELPDGPGGGPSFLEVGDNGNWWIDGKDTGEKANELTPKINTSATDGQYFWEFPVVENDGIKWVKGPKAIAAAYAVEAEDGSWTLWLPTSKDMSKLVEIPLTGSGSGGGLTKIDILGWVEDYDVEGNLSTGKLEVSHTATDPLTGELFSAANKTFVVYYNVIEKFAGDTNRSSKPVITTAAPNHTYTSGATPPNIYMASTTAYDPAVKSFNIATGTALTTLDAQNKGLIVQVHPSGESISSVDFVLENSQKKALPIAFKKPKLVTGLLTRAAADSDLWFIEGSDKGVGTFKNDAEFADDFTPEALYTLVTPAGFRSEYTPFTFTPTLVSSLEGQVIEVGDNEFTPEVAATATTPKVEAAFYVNVGVDNTLGFDDVYFFDATPAAIQDQARHDQEVGGADPYVTTPLTAPAGTASVVNNGVHTKRYTNSVIDYYMVVGSNHADGYVTTEFGLYFDGDKANKTGGKSFTITQLPDELTQAWFFMDVYKLGIDGIVYYERVKIYPTREDIITEIEITEPYIVEDGLPATTGNNATDYLGSILNVPLDEMFAHLATFSDPQKATMAQRWQDELWGAKKYTVTNLSIEGHTAAENTANGGKGFLYRFMFPNYIEKGLPRATTPATGSNAVTDAPATQANFAGIETVAGQSEWMLGEKATAIFAIDTNGKTLDPALGEDYPLWDARSFELYPNYAYNTGTAEAPAANKASFEIGKKHTFTIEFYDINGQKLNTLKVTFTPKLPELNELFVREPEYWDGDVLNAYYKTPDNWYEAKFYGVNTAAAAAAVNDQLSSVAGTPRAENSTFYNVYNPGGTTTMKHSYLTPLDGGYTKVGIRNNTDKRWVNSTEIALRDADQKIGTVNASTLVAFNINYTTNNTINMETGVAGPTTAKSVIELFDQTNAFVGGGTTAPNFVNLPKPEPNPYGKVLGMKWNLGPYIGYYEMKGTEEFDLKVMSALAEGEVKEVAGAVVGDAAPANGKYLSLNDDHITLENYNDQPFSVFKVWDTGKAAPVYAYTYIYRVEFSRPAGVSVYDIMTPVYTSGVITSWDQANAVATAIAPTEDDESYVALRPNNITDQANTKIHVKVYDRFGRTVTGDVNITLNVAKIEK